MPIPNSYIVEIGRKVQSFITNVFFRSSKQIDHISDPTELLERLKLCTIKTLMSFTIFGLGIGMVNSQYITTNNSPFINIGIACSGIYTIIYYRNSMAIIKKLEPKEEQEEQENEKEDELDEVAVYNENNELLIQQKHDAYIIIVKDTQGVISPYFESIDEIINYRRFLYSQMGTNRLDILNREYLGKFENVYLKNMYNKWKDTYYNN